MAASSRQVALNASTATLLWVTESTPAATAGHFQAHDAGDPVPMIVQNIDSTIVIYLGPASMTDTTVGFPLAAGASLPSNVVGSDSMYAIAASGTPKAAVLSGRQ